MTLVFHNKVKRAYLSDLMLDVCSILTMYYPLNKTVGESHSVKFERITPHVVVVVIVLILYYYWFCKWFFYLWACWSRSDSISVG